MPSSPSAFVATAPRGLLDLLATEVAKLGATDVETNTAVVRFSGPLEVAYRVCLWSRVANRVLLPIARFAAPSPEALYDGARGIAWADHFGADDTLAVDFTSVASQVSHTHFGALKVKDAVVDQFRERTGARPSVELENPTVRINVHLDHDEATVAIDLAGASLHQRGYRRDTGPAPLKENIAAAVLLRCHWQEAAAEGGGLVDPMCGSGTLPIEAALMALDFAPGLLRERFGFSGWRQHDGAIWRSLIEEARARRRSQTPSGPIIGYDEDGRAIDAAQRNLERAGLRGVVHVERRALSRCEPPTRGKPGLVVVNPPYGERLGEVEKLRALYAELGTVLKHRFGHWSAHVLSGNGELLANIGLRASRRHTLWNGPIECQLAHYRLTPLRERRAEESEALGPRSDAERRTAPSDTPAPGPSKSLRPGPDAQAKPAAGQPSRLSPGAQMVANRLKKNHKNLARFCKREGVTCFRVYDADLPEYAAAIDLYEGFAHVQEYAPPASVDPKAAERRLRELLSAVPEALGIEPAHVFLKVRQRQRGSAQYEKLGEQGALHEVHEGGHRFLVNFEEYLDTGLFLDHRLVRRLVGELARGQDVLNLFAYTGTATVYAAKGGARTTTSVDLSNTYLRWAERNLKANGIGGSQHRLVQADCRVWLDEAAQEGRRYGLILLDPPTFSNSKRMEGTLDIQRDSGELLGATAALLAPGGVLIFSTNYRRFRMDPDALPGYAVAEITKETIPPDFARNPHIHRAWRISHAHER